MGEFPKVCSQIVLKCLWLARIGRPDIPWSVNKLARSITKWTKACDKRFSRLISYIHHTCENKQYCHVGNTAKQCRLGLFQDSDFAWDLEALKIYFRWNIVHFRKPHVRSNQLWMCKKQTSVSHSSTESEIISLDAGSRMGGKPALDLWDLIVAVLHGNTSQSKQVQGDFSTSLTRKKIPGKIDDLNNVEFVSSNANSFRKEAMLYIFEDNEAVIKMIVKGIAQWDMFPEPTELLLIGCLVGSIYTPRFKSNTLALKTNSQTHWPRETSHVMSGTSFCVCSTSAISVPLTVSNPCRKERKNMQVKKESQQNQSRWWIWYQDAV